MKTRHTMRRLLLSWGLLVLCGFALAQAGQQPAEVQPGLKVAAPPRRVEPPSPTASAQELETRGDELRSDKYFLDAVDYYRAALAKAPSAVLYNKRGIAELQMQRFKESIADFERAIKLNRQEPDFY